MILKLYKSNQVPVLFVLPVVILLLWLPDILASKELIIESTSPLYHFISQLLPGIAGQISAIGIIFLSAIILNTIINNNDIFDRNTHLPALFYVILMSYSNEYHTLSPIIISNLFVLLALRRLLSIYRQMPCKREIFDASVLLLLGGLFYFPHVVLFPIVWIALSVFRPFVWREWVLPVLGTMVVSVYILTSLIAKGDFSSLEQYLNISSGQYQSITQKITWLHFIIFFLMAVAVGFSGYHMLKISNKSSIRFRKISMFLLYFISLSIGQILFEKMMLHNENYMLIASVPLSILLTFYFQNASIEWLANLIFYLLFAAIIVNIYWI